jgi:hypothetical protein
MLQKRVDDVSEDDDEWEPVKPIRAHVTAFLGTEGQVPVCQFK